MKFIIAVLCYTFSSSLFAQPGSIKGTVSDGLQPLPLVNIVILDAFIGTSSNDDGSYKINNLPPGKYKIKFSAVGFTTEIFEASVLSGKTTELNVNLKPALIQVDEVKVTGYLRGGQNDTQTSLIDLNPESAKIQPGAVEDVFRTLQSLPGVLAPNDFSSQLIIRGSGPDQNLIIMDDVEIFNPYRLYGVISMFNPDAVSNVDLITGGFPASYGDRLSAVLDVTNREGTKKKSISGNLNASIVDANLVLEGKNPFNLNGSWLIDSRRTYYDLIIEPFVKGTGLVDDNVSFPNFYDVQTKLVIGPYNGSKFLIDGIYSRDGVNVVSGNKRKTADSIGVSNETRNDVFSFAWHYNPSDNIFNKLIMSWYRNGGAADLNSQILDPSLNRQDFKNVILDTLAPYLYNFKFNTDFSFRKYSFDDKFAYYWSGNIFEAGAGVDFLQNTIFFKFQIAPELMAILRSNPRFNSALNDLKDVTYYNRYHAYVQNKFMIDNLNIQPGLRFDYYDNLQKAYLSPRLSLSYALGKLTTLRASWGIYYQSPGYEKLRDQNVLFDLNRVYTEKLDAEKAIHYVLGFDRWLNSEWNLKIEGYYKDFSNLIVPEVMQGATYLTERIPGKDPRYTPGWSPPVAVKGDSVTQVPVNGSYGEAYGIELLLSKKNLMNSDKLSGWISYSHAFANRLDNGIKTPFRFDQRNTVNIVLDYRVNSWFSVGCRWQYGSGFPYTEPTGVKPRIILTDQNDDGKPETPQIATRGSYFNPDDNRVIFDIDYGGNKFNARKPAYHRLDIRFTALAEYWNMNWTFYLDVINAYNHKNVIGYDYYVNQNLTLGREASTMFPIIPTLGFSVKF